MANIKKRVYIGGLFTGITENDLRERFSKFGQVENVELKVKKGENGFPDKTFAYMDLLATDENLQTCFSVYNKCKWKGEQLRLQFAKEDFLKRLIEERKNNFGKTETQKKKVDTLDDPLEGIAGVENFQMKGAVPGTPVGKDKNWVVGKYGRVMPVVNLRKRNKRHMVTIDPSKFVHNVKKLKMEDTQDSSDVKGLTWEINNIETEANKRRRGEYPSWKPKNSKNNTVKSQAELMTILTKLDTKKWSGEDDFEVVPETNVSETTKNPVYFSENDDSDQEMSYDKSSEKQSAKNKDVKEIQPVSRISCTEKISEEITQTHQCKKKAKLEHEEKLQPSFKKDKVIKSTECIPKTEIISIDIKNTVNTSKDLIGNNRLTTLSFNDDENVIAETLQQMSSGPCTSKSKRPKIQPFLGTRQLYEEDNGKTSLASKGNSVVNSVVDKPTVKDKKNKPRADQNSGITLIASQTVDDSDNESVSSADTDVIILSQKKHAHIAMQSASLLDSVGNVNTVSEYQSGIVEDYEAESQQSIYNEFYQKQLCGGDDDSDYDENDFKKLVEKLSKRTLPLRMRKSTPDSDGEFEEVSLAEGKQLTVKMPLKSKSVAKKKDKMASLLTHDGKLENVNKLQQDKGQSENKKINCATKQEEKEKFKHVESSDNTSKSSNNKCIDSEISNQNMESKTSIETEPRKGKTKKLEKGKNCADDGDSSDNSNSESNIKSNQKQNVDELGKLKTVHRDDNQVTVVKGDKGVNEDKMVKDKEEGKEKKAKKIKAKEKEKLAVEANLKRLESLKINQEETKSRKSAIQQALMSVDKGRLPNKKIIFDSDESENENEITVNTDKTQVGDSSSDSESTDDEESLQVKTEVRDNKMNLFAGSSDDSSEEDDDDETFKLKPQFEGQDGKLLMGLQMKIGSDSRFKVDSRFMDSDQEEDEEDKVIKEEDEKTRALRVLGEVIGENLSVHDKREKDRKMFKDMSALQYDPNRDDHSQFEMKSSKDVKKDKKKSKSKEKKKAVLTDIVENEEEEKLPEVSGEKFYTVSESLEDAFRGKTDTEGEGTSSQFSLLAAFGTKHSDDEDEEQDFISEEPITKLPWQQEELLDSSGDEDSESDMETEHETAENKKTPVVFTQKKTLTFFFSEDDERIKEGIKSFCRHEDEDTLREKWLAVRPALVEAYKTKHKRLVRKNRQLEKKRTAQQHQGK